MVRVSDRHEGDLGGRLEPFGASRPAVVALSIPRDVAGEAACQHAVWMLVNLLARSEGIVGRLVLHCPPDIPLVGRVVPLADRSLHLAEALVAGARAIDIVPVVLDDSGDDPTIRLVVGPGEPIDGWLRVHGEAWWGGVSQETIESVSDSPLPLGPYVAAALGAAEVFRAVRLRGYSPQQAAFYSLASFRAMTGVPRDAADIGPVAVDDLTIAATLAGVGAVGSMWVHTMWAFEGITGEANLADADELGVDLTNLNRCPIFSRASVGKRKATEAAAQCHDASLKWRPHDGLVGDVEHRHSLMLSAVDTNASRQAIQGLYPPRLISASTQDLRAELLRCDPNAGSACLHCYNRVEVGPTDDEVRRKYLAMNPDERTQFAEQLSLSVADADAWAIDGVCGYAGDRIAAHLRPGSGPAAFAVGFVSAMSGVMLAAQTIKEALDDEPLGGLTARALMQFMDPVASTNGTRLYGRDPNCAMCQPSSLAFDIWRQRYEAYRSPTG